MSLSSRVALLIFLIISPTAYAQSSGPKALSELINRQEPAWDFVSQWIKQAKNTVQVLPRTSAQADSALWAAQVTTRSPMGAVIYETGGLLIDGGWLRIVGSGSPRLNRTLMGWNQGKPAGILLVADDVLGGFYALNGGAFGSESLGKIFYFAPDNLQWEPIDKTYSEFLQFCFSGDLQAYYRDARWPGWEKEISTLSGTQGLACYPFLFTQEGKNIRRSKRAPVPIQELWDFGQDMQRQVGQTSR